MWRNAEKEEKMSGPAEQSANAGEGPSCRQLSHEQGRQAGMVASSHTDVERVPAIGRNDKWKTSKLIAEWERGRYVKLSRSWQRSAATGPCATLELYYVHYN